MLLSTSGLFCTIANALALFNFFKFSISFEAIFSSTPGFNIKTSALALSNSFKHLNEPTFFNRSGLFANQRAFYSSNSFKKPICSSVISPLNSGLLTTPKTLLLDLTPYKFLPQTFQTSLSLRYYQPYSEYRARYKNICTKLFKHKKLLQIQNKDTSDSLLIIGNKNTKANKYIET